MKIEQRPDTPMIAFGQLSPGEVGRVAAGDLIMRITNTVGVDAVNLANGEAYLLGYDHRVTRVDARVVV